MSLKFEKNRSVSEGYCLIPLFYTGIKHSNNSDKELVIMDRMGKNFTACWRNNALCKVGILFLLPAVDKDNGWYGFIFKDKTILFKDCNKVW